MSDDSQIVVPPSFIAIYVAPGKIKPSISRDQLVQRYEFCEDFAQVLLEQAKTKQWELGISQDVVIERISQGLKDAQDQWSAQEATWIITRLVELLEA